jgi:ubiquinone/menaquinone biosynthesis C-methylase UbiE
VVDLAAGEASPEIAHHEAVRQEFSRQADSFEDPKYSLADPRHMRWIIGDRFPLQAGDRVLDVAAGPGILARALAPRVAYVLALDVTPAMLEVGQQAAAEAGLGNMTFALGDAANLPFLDDSFDLVVSRFAIHHFRDAGQAIAEMARVCRPGGHVGLVDLVSAEPAFAQRYNDFERLCDPTHTRALTEPELRRHSGAAGLEIGISSHHDYQVPLELWLQQAQTPPERAQEIRRAVQLELARGPATGLRPADEAGELMFTQRIQLAIASKARPDKG